MVKTRRLPEPITVETGLPADLIYCRKCQNLKKEKYFYKAVDLEIDSNGRFSVCRECIDEMYGKVLESEFGSIQKTVLYMCKKLNVKYDEGTIESAIKQIDSLKIDPKKFFGVYRSKLLNVARSSSDSGVDLTYSDNPIINMGEEYNLYEGFSPSELESLKSFWGFVFSNDEISILEQKYMRWSESHSIDTESERVLLKLICIKELEIDKAIAIGSSTTVLLKEFQELLKTSGLNPSSATLAGTNKAQETWGNFVKMIEETEPAEYYKDDNLFKDYDKIDEYFKKYVVRPLKNFITGTKDFNIETEQDYIDDDFTDDEPVIPLEYKLDEESESSDAKLQ